MSIRNMLFGAPAAAYPVAVRPAPESLLQGGEAAGSEVFDAHNALTINKGRMDWIGSLGLPLKGKQVLDVGCGVGHLAQFFVKQGSDVLCTDARPENIDRLRQLYPGLRAELYDVEQPLPAPWGTFDVVFCFGLVYHLENPVAAIRHLAAACRGILLMETIVCDSDKPVLLYEDESFKNPNQSLRVLGCRPSPSFVAMILNRVGFPHVYGPRRVPDHQDFQFRWLNDLTSSRNGHPIRAVFVASMAPLNNENLVPLLKA